MSLKANLVMLLRERRLFLRIFLYFLSLLIFASLLSGIFYIKYSNMTKKQFATKIMNGTIASGKQIDFMLTTSYEASLNFLNSQIVKKYYLPDAQMTLTEKVEMPRIADAVASASSIITNYSDKMFVYNDDKRVFLSNGAEDFNLFFNKFYRFEGYSTDFWKRQLQSDKKFEILPPATIRDNGKQVVTFLTIGMVNGNETVVGITIPVDVIRNTFQQNAIFKKSNFFVLDSNQNAILNSDQKKEIQDLAAQLGVKYQSGYVETSFSGAPSICTYTVSNIFGWRYYSFTPISSINKHVQGMFNYFLIISIIVVFIGILLSFMFSLRIYNPIKKIRDIIEENDDIHQLKKSAVKNEFQLIDQGIRKMHATQTQFKHKFEQISIEYLDHNLSSLIGGQPCENDHTFREILRNDLHFQSDTYFICNILFEFTEDFYKEIQDIDRFNIMSKLKKVLDTLLSEQIPCYIMEYKPSLYFCLIDAGQSADIAIADLRKAIKKIISIFQFDFNYCAIYFGIGEPFSQLNQLSDYFGEAMTAFHQRNKAKQFEIIEARTMNIQHQFFYSAVEENIIIQKLEEGNLQELERQVSNIITVNYKRGVSHSYMRLLFHELYQTGYRFMLDQGVDIKRVLKDQYLEKLWDRPDISLNDNSNSQKLLQFYEEVVRCSSANEQELEESSSMVDLIISYIENHYDQDLYLEKISEEIGISPKYLSRMFKEKTQTNITDYISFIRISKAKMLLMDTPMKISDIGEKVGFFSRTTFLRIFRKMEGVSPSQYRKLHRS